MCYAIIEVTYRGSMWPKETIKVSDNEALEKRLETLQSLEQVECIRVFTLRTALVRTTTWSVI